MTASVVVRSKDEADRLRLTLASLAHQTEPAQIVVVNDGSSDHTRDVIAAMNHKIPIVAIHHEAPLGRSAAANAGAAAASGDIVIFLDGDTLAAPDFVAGHMDVHRQRGGLVVRGETLHLRCTRVFLDPATGSPMPGLEAQVARMSSAEKERSRITDAQIAEDFDAIDRRAQPGVYPGFGPRKLLELEMAALRANQPEALLWMAASGSNQSLPRSAFLEAGGFHPSLSINEHRELALRLMNAGLRMAATKARSYHLIHRSGWRDPLLDRDWEAVFYAEHPTAAVPLMTTFWASLSDPAPFPEAARIGSLAELAKAAHRYQHIRGADEVRAAHLRWSQQPPSAAVP